MEIVWGGHRHPSPSFSVRLSAQQPASQPANSRRQPATYTIIATLRAPEYPNRAPRWLRKPNKTEQIYRVFARPLSSLSRPSSAVSVIGKPLIYRCLLLSMVLCGQLDFMEAGKLIKTPMRDCLRGGKQCSQLTCALRAGCPMAIQLLQMGAGAPNTGSEIEDNGQA